MSRSAQLINQIDDLLAEGRADEFSPTPVKRLTTASAAEDSFVKHIPDAIRKVPALNDRDNHAYAYASGLSSNKRDGSRLNNFHDELKTHGNHLGSYTPQGNIQNDDSKSTISHYVMGASHYLVSHKAGQTSNISTSVSASHYMDGRLNRMYND